MRGEVDLFYANTARDYSVTVFVFANEAGAATLKTLAAGWHRDGLPSRFLRNIVVAYQPPGAHVGLKSPMRPMLPRVTRILLLLERS